MTTFFGIIILSLMGIIYYFIISEKMNKAAITFSAGTIVLFLAAVFSHFFPSEVTERMKLITLDDLSTYVDFKTIGLLIGMMILIPFIEKSGFFQIVAIYVIKLSKGNLKSLFIITSLIVAFCSAFLNNVSTVMVFVPIILAITDAINKNPFPFLIVIGFSVIFNQDDHTQYKIGVLNSKTVISDVHFKRFSETKFIEKIDFDNEEIEAVLLQ